MTDRENRERGTRQWDDANWVWITAALGALLILGGVAVGNHGDRPRTAFVPDDATTGQGIRPAADPVALAVPAPRP